MKKQQPPSKHYRQRIEELSGEPLPLRPERTEGKIDKVQSARQTRLRKKIYVALLEHKLRLKEEELAELQAQVAKLKQERSQQRPSHPAIEALKYRTDLFQRIEEGLRNQDQQQTRHLLDALRLRYGVAGEERRGLLDSALRQFLEYMMPMHFRYLLDSCNQKKQFYQLFAENQQYKLHMNFDFLSLNEKKELAKVRPLLCEYKHSYDHLVQQLLRFKELVIRQNQLSQGIVDGLSRAFNPCFLAEFLLKLDQKRTGERNINGIYPISYWEALNRGTVEQQRSRALKDISSYSFSDPRDDQQHSVVPSEGRSEMSELNYLL